MGTAVVPNYSALLKTCQDLHRKVYMQAVKTLHDFYWDLGNEINKALRDEKPTYGEATVSKLSEDLNLDESMLYKCMALAGKFDRGEMSPRLPWSHIRALLPLEAEAARALARKAEEKQLSLKALKVEIARIKEKRYADQPARLAAAKLSTALNPLSGIPAVAVIEGIGVRKIDSAARERLLARVSAAEAKLRVIHGFLVSLEVVPALEESEAQRRTTRKGKSVRPPKS